MEPLRLCFSAANCVGSIAAWVSVFIVAFHSVLAMTMGEERKPMRCPATGSCSVIVASAPA